MMSYTEEEYNDFEKRLHERFSEMFSQPYGGVAVGKGWWQIIESLCVNIQDHVNWRNEHKEKYNRGEGCQPVVVDQIKEKFGGLRFYYTGGDDTVDGMVRMAESWAASSCEVCGVPGKLRSGGWMRTLCDYHEEERQLQMKTRYGDD
jgi:hypothetical protein